MRSRLFSVRVGLAVFLLSHAHDPLTATVRLTLASADVHRLFTTLHDGAKADRGVLC